RAAARDELSGIQRVNRRQRVLGARKRGTGERDSDWRVAEVIGDGQCSGVIARREGAECDADLTTVSTLRNTIVLAGMDIPECSRRVDSEVDHGVLLIRDFNDLRRAERADLLCWKHES